MNERIRLFDKSQKFTQWDAEQEKYIFYPLNELEVKEHALRIDPIHIDNLYEGNNDDDEEEDDFDVTVEESQQDFQQFLNKEKQFTPPKKNSNKEEYRNRNSNYNNNLINFTKKENNPYLSQHKNFSNNDINTCLSVSKRETNSKTNINSIINNDPNRLANNIKDQLFNNMKDNKPINQYPNTKRSSNSSNNSNHQITNLNNKKANDNTCKNISQTKLLEPGEDNSNFIKNWKETLIASEANPQFKKKGKKGNQTKKRNKKKNPISQKINMASKNISKNLINESMNLITELESEFSDPFESGNGHKANIAKNRAKTESISSMFAFQNIMSDNKINQVLAEEDLTEYEFTIDEIKSNSSPAFCCVITFKANGNKAFLYPFVYIKEMPLEIGGDYKGELVPFLRNKTLMYYCTSLTKND